MANDEQAKGLEVIDAHLRVRMGREPDFSYGTLIPWALGGPDPLDTIYGYRLEEPTPHVYLIGLGMTELHEKETEYPEVSGWGFELTFRVASEPDSDPPAWALNVMQNLARYVWDTGNPFDANHTIPLNGPIEQDADTDIHALAFVGDPVLGGLRTPNGGMRFLQMVGLTTDEIDKLIEWDTEAFLRYFASLHPLYVTDLDRLSILTNPAQLKRIDEMALKEGSSRDAFHVGSLTCDLTTNPMTVYLPALCIRDLNRVLVRRVPYNRSLLLLGDACVNFKPGDSPAAEPGTFDGYGDPVEMVDITCDAALVKRIVTTLKPQRGRYTVPGLDVVFEVRPSDILDNDGNVTDTIG